ncbi:MAG: hypothetical protein LUC37_01335 [Prevotella sp.]|nr:hypothetical protein [Prevotella sp.]
MAEIGGISLYEANKQITINDTPLTDNEIKNEIRKIIKPLILRNQDRYFMLLCREQYDYTLFNFYNKDNTTIKTTIYDIWECLTNRGQVMSILESDLQQESAEIWLKIDDEVFLYMFFPYDSAVLEEGV